MRTTVRLRGSWPSSAGCAEGFIKSPDKKPTERMGAAPEELPWKRSRLTVEVHSRSGA